MTREEAKEIMLTYFEENVIICKTMVSFCAGFPDEFEPFDEELYDMVEELANEGKLKIFNFEVSGEFASVLFPKDAILISEPK